MLDVEHPVRAVLAGRNLEKTRPAALCRMLLSMTLQPGRLTAGVRKTPLETDLGRSEVVQDPIGSPPPAESPPISSRQAMIRPRHRAGYHGHQAPETPRMEVCLTDLLRQVYWGLQLDRTLP